MYAAVGVVKLIENIFVAVRADVVDDVQASAFACHRFPTRR